MTVAEDISQNAKATFRTTWISRDGQVIPAPSDLKLSNDAVYFARATVLYADLDQSTSLVEDYTWEIAAEIYKAFLYASSRLIRDAGGSIVSYDGDRVMGIFISKTQNNDAVGCALKINYAVKKLLQEAFGAQYTHRDYKIRHVVGIDESPIRAARTGVRGDNDLVWVGDAANLAAKLTTRSADYSVWITDRVYAGLNDGQKLSATGKNIWTWWNWVEHKGEKIYSTTFWRTF